MNNLIALLGHVGQDPHSVSFEDTGNKVVKFSLAVKEFSSNTDEEKTLWIDVDCLEWARRQSALYRHEGA
jgi:single-stranded DNA-binding protein